MNDAVAVTGVGILSPLGIGFEAFAAGLAAARPGIGPITSFDTTARRSHCAAQIPAFDPSVLLPGIGVRNFDRVQLLAAGAARLALQNAGDPHDFYDDERLGVVLGSTCGYVHSVAKFYGESITEGPSYVSPIEFANTVMNAPAGRVATLFQLRGPNVTLASGGVSGFDALIYGAEMVREGRAAAVLAGGLLSLSEKLHLGFCQSEVLSPGRNGGEELCAPFDRRHNGMLLGEGAAFLLLERSSDARARGVRVQALLSGSGRTFDPSPASQAENLHDAMVAALSEADVDANAISYVSAAANSDPETDRSESLAIRRLLRGLAGGVPTSAGKSAWGECLDAAGPIQAVSAIAAIQQSFVPPTLSFETADADCELDVVGETRDAAVRHVLVNGSSCSGSAAALVISSPEAMPA